MDLVAGGAGFIGANLCRRLLAEGRRVLCVDNLVTGSHRNIEGLLQQPGFEFVEVDIVEQVPEVSGIERIFHLASPASPPGYLLNAVPTLRVNSEGTQTLLELARRSGARFLYASSSEIYGDPIEHPQREDSPARTNPVGPRSMYHEAKRFGEALTMSYARSGLVDTRIVRIFNTYGPYSDPDDGRLIPNFVTQALRGAPLTVYGDGSQTRSFCYVTDLIEGLIRVIGSPSCEGQVINLGNPDERSVGDCARLIIQITGTASTIEHVEPITEEEPRRRCPDISKARQLTGWMPVVEFRRGIDETIDYFRRTASAENALAVGY